MKFDVHLMWKAVGKAVMMACGLTNSHIVTAWKQECWPNMPTLTNMPYLH